jgi:hypothetical protein
MPTLLAQVYVRTGTVGFAIGHPALQAWAVLDQKLLLYTSTI